MAFSRALDSAGEHFLAPGIVPFPRGLAQDEVVAFDFTSSKVLGTAMRLPRLHGQASVVFP